MQNVRKIGPARSYATQYATQRTKDHVFVLVFDSTPDELWTPDVAYASHNTVYNLPELEGDIAGSGLPKYKI